MNIRWYIIIFIFTFTLFSVGSYTLTRAYFTHTVVSANHTFKTAESFDNVNQPSEPDETLEDTSGGIVINEVSARGGDDLDWIEIYNTSDEEFNLDGWRIEDNTFQVTISEDEFILQPGQYVILVSSQSAVPVPSNVKKIALSGIIGNGLNPSSDKALLRNGDNTIVDQVSWGSNKSIFELSQITEGNTLQRIPNGKDTDVATDWQVGNPTPGGANN